MKKFIVGILALQGDFREHINILKKMNIRTKEIKLPGQLDGIDGLIIPGGESTTIDKLFKKYGFRGKLEEFAKSGKPIFGTCAGLIVLSAATVNKKKQLSLIDIDIERNAYGRQIESFEKYIDLNLNHTDRGKKFNSIFIRAPKITRTGKNIKILGRNNGEVVLVRDKNILVCAFHPELTDDPRIHQYFITMIIDSLKEK
ncbi:MAG TPA: pyridoxal 5'-phosphate synthase glutaminase subunit PdxT [Actinobacteria bacterium]|nr:pyridoxal 5'-phosphate synthase glutaminase subunit PdxT [Actinomycetota bacterium]